MIAALTLAALAALTAPPTLDSTRPDVVIADFEGDDYGGWKTTGTAFGEAPARGTLPGQMPVAGYLGRGLVNSYHDGDGSTGELTSPPFRIDREHLNFLIGGGGWEKETCLDLLVDGKVVHSATGPNREPGGSERLRWAAWDVRDLQGKEAVLRVVDQRKGGWGHINVDQIVQTDRPKIPQAASRTIVLQNRYLHIPVKTGAQKVRAKIEGEGGKILHEFDVELAPGEPDFLAFADLESFKGKSVTFRVDEVDDPKALEQIVQADHVPNAAGLYKEPHRPQFHFTSRRGWLNDPNGLVWHDGEYHLFYQHNPYGWGWGNMHWGHAVSPDLVHWTELPIALYPHKYGDWAFSGSAVTDHGNTSGFGKDGKNPLVAAYTSTGRGECIVFSNDRGRTWTEFEGNPVVKHDGRDPRLLWYAPGKHWVMAVYDEDEKVKPVRRSIDFYTSTDLKAWTFASRLDGFYECPDLFELPVDGDPNKKLWVVYAADGQYKLGAFDGKTFTPTSGPDKHTLWHGNFYAAQTFSDEPKGRRIQIGWARDVKFPGSAFNQQMNLPVELTLRTTTDGPRMFAEPVAELDALQQDVKDFSHWKNVTPDKLPPKNLQPEFSLPLNLQVPIYAKSMQDMQRQMRDRERKLKSYDACVIDLAFRPIGAMSLNLKLRGTTLVYDVARQDLSCKQVRAFVPQVDGLVRLKVYVDAGSIEVFANRGQAALSIASLPDAGNHSFEVATVGGAVDLEQLKLYSLQSSWPDGGR
ncbi:glycoside hydrolase family 32 protein [Paludisphaera rhizosphaerae]|uniref:glycoside hydrolase family 32 protein n=1 Tax=Paludisphaera rhizosphaerae TaxID=2711216 RepID=UPI0013EB6F83|nr:glycoside hydrolase family 32 protein [Paludisphaera rhizosphaerae]